MKIIQPISLWSWLSLISLGALASDYGEWHKDFDIKPDHQKILVNQLNNIRNAFSTGGISGNGKNFQINGKKVYATKLPSLTWERELAGRAKMTAGDCRTISEQNQPGVTIQSTPPTFSPLKSIFPKPENTYISMVLRVS